MKRLERLFERPNRDDVLYFLRTGVSDELAALYRFADDVRRQYVGDEIHLRAIIEFSNYCRRGCLYCGINKHCKNVTRYRMSPAEIIAAANDAYEKGYRTVVLQSGEDPYYAVSDYFYILRELKMYDDMAITLSIGEKNDEEYLALYRSGAHRFLLKHETSNPEVYRELNPGMDLDYRLECLRILKKTGFQTGGGIMIGLPGQTLESIANDIILFKELDLDMMGCGPFVPHPGTPLKDHPNGSVELTFRVLALNRIVTRDTHLPATTALSTINGPDGRRLALQRGANVIMPNMTPAKFRKFYEIYPNKKRTEVSSTDFRKELEELAASLGRSISNTPGHRVKRENKSPGAGTTNPQPPDR